MNESLGASQVLSYLFKLSTDFDYYLISLEKSSDWNNTKKMDLLRKELIKYNIHWIPLLYKEDKVGKYLNWIRFTKKAFELTKNKKIKYIHCRSYFPALSAYFIKKIKPIKYLFDTRGFAFDERVDTGGISRNSFLFKIFKKYEKLIYLSAAGVNKLSQEGKRTILENELFEGGDKVHPITVIPTCVNLDRFQKSKKNYSNVVKIGYTGNVKGWYDFDQTLKTIKAIGAYVPFHFSIFNGNQHDYILAKLEEYEIGKDNFSLEKVDFKDMPDKLKDIEISLFFIRPYFSRRASAATRMGEYLASGIPILTNGNDGDHKSIINKYGCGEIIDPNHLENYDFINIVTQLRKEEISTTCRFVAEKYFSLEKGVEDYKKLYQLSFFTS